MAKINVLYLITKATAGGAQKYVYDLATNMPKSQFDVIVAYGERGRLARDLAVSGIKLRELPSLARDIAILSDIKSFVEMLKMFKELRPDIVHLNSSKAAGLGALAARIAHVPRIVFTVHGWPFKESRNMLSRSLIYFVSWLTAVLSHATIVVSHADERAGKQMWGVAKKIHYIPLGIKQFAPLTPSEGYRRMFGTLSPAPLKNSTLRIVTIAELTKNKGIRYGIEAIRLLSDQGKDAIYVVVSEGEEREALSRFARERGVDDRVFFPGYVEDAARNLAGFDVFLLPSLKEGMPNVLLEAAHVGLPVVATEAIDPEFAREISNARLVPTADSDALARAILEVSKLSRIKSEQRETLESMVQRTIALYQTAPTNSVSSRA